MFEKTKTSVKNFVEEHKTAIAVATTATICLVINRIALSQHDEFLKEHDLYNEFYHEGMIE